LLKVGFTCSSSNKCVQTNSVIYSCFLSSNKNVTVRISHQVDSKFLVQVDHRADSYHQVFMLSVIEQMHFMLSCHQTGALKLNQPLSRFLPTSYTLSVIEWKHTSPLSHQMRVLKWIGHRADYYLWFMCFSVRERKHWPVIKQIPMVSMMQ